MLHDDLRRRVDLLDLADEADALSSVALGVLRIANDEGKLRNDAEVPNPLRQREGLLGLQLLVHLAQHPIGAGFGAEENHRRAGPFQGPERLIRIAEHRVHPGFAPPAQLQGREAAGEFTRVIFAQEKVVVVKLDRIDAIRRFQMPQHSRGPLRRLHLLVAEDRNDAAEVTAERAPDTGLVRRRAAATNGQDVLGRIKPVIRGPGKVPRRSQGPLRIVNMPP